MCGIAGKVNFNHGIGDQITRESEQSIRALRHRGPDASGSYQDEHVLMVNTRLQITGNESGQQPIYSVDNNYVIVFNGEIYNYRELRQTLIGRGYVFHSNCDTEVVLNIYIEFKQEGFAMLNGMFSICIFDKVKSEVTLARDRFGVKPLYYEMNSSTLIFASELKALKELGANTNHHSSHGLASFLGLMYIPEPWSIYKGINKLRAGHCLTLNANGSRVFPFFTSCYDKIDISYNDARTEVARLLHLSVNRQLNTKVKSGILISGGLDSRCVLAASTDYGEVEGHTIAFSDQQFDEAGQAKYWTDILGKKHNIHRVGQERFSDHILERFRHLDEPYSLWCNVATSCMAEHLGQQGLKVVLGGDGGDELFLGYPTIQAAFLANNFNKVTPRAAKGIIAKLANKLPAGKGKLPLPFLLKSFLSVDSDDIYKMFFGFKEVVKYTDWPNLLTPEAYELVKGLDPYFVFSQYKDDIKDLGAVDAMSFLDKKVFMSGCGFAGNDNAYMAHGIEHRVPFMDNDLDSFVCSLPESVKFKFLRLKPLLNDAFRHNFPAVNNYSGKVHFNYKKSGFEVPIQHWLTTGKSGHLVKTVLGKQWTQRLGFFKWPAVEKILNQQIQGKQNNERVIQSIFVLHLFLDGTYEV